jgi:hypothetical protein
MRSAIILSLAGSSLALPFGNAIDAGKLRTRPSFPRYTHTYRLQLWVPTLRLARARASPTSPSLVVVLQAVDSPSLVATPLEAFLAVTLLGAFLVATLLGALPVVTPLGAFLVATLLEAFLAVTLLGAFLVATPLEALPVVTPLGAFLVATLLGALPVVTLLGAFLVATLLEASPVVKLLAHPSPLEDSLAVTPLGASLSLVAVLPAAVSPVVKLLAYLSQLVVSLVVVLSEVPPAHQKAVLPASLSHLVDFLSQVHLLPDA